MLPRVIRALPFTSVRKIEFYRRSVGNGTELLGRVDNRYAGLYPLFAQQFPH